jgi:hypothetical protein
MQIGNSEFESQASVPQGIMASSQLTEQDARDFNNFCGTPSKRWDIPAVADLLGVSTSWVRRHLAEIPHERRGRLIRFDPVLLSQHPKTTMQGGKSLRPERALMPSRYQWGYVYQSGSKRKVWYGMFREDIRTPRWSD